MWVCDVPCFVLGCLADTAAAGAWVDMATSECFLPLFRSRAEEVLREVLGSPFNIT